MIGSVDVGADIGVEGSVAAEGAAFAAVVSEADIVESSAAEPTADVAANE